MPLLEPFHSKLSDSSLLTEQAWSFWKNSVTPSSQSWNCVQKRGLHWPFSPLLLMHLCLWLRRTKTEKNLPEMSHHFICLSKTNPALDEFPFFSNCLPYTHPLSIFHFLCCYTLFNELIVETFISFQEFVAFNNFWLVSINYHIPSQAGTSEQ